MIAKYLRLAFRQMLKHKFSFFIAIFCLCICLAATAQLISYTLYHLDYDKSVSNAKGWYRLRYSSVIPEYGTMDSAAFPFIPLTHALGDFPQIKELILMWQTPMNINTRCDDKLFPTDKKCYTTSNFPKHYGLEMIYGNPDSLLNSAEDMIISHSYSQQFFGDQNPIGKQITNPNGKVLHRITGVFKDPPPNLHLKHDYYVLWTDKGTEVHEDDLYFTGHVRLQIPDKEDLPQIKSQIEALLREHPYASILLGEISVHLDPISDIHFITGLKDDAASVSKLNIYMILAITIIALIVALINFIIIIGLAWTKRRDEFYFRRTLGASRGDIALQLFLESALYFSVALALSIPLYLFTFSFFSQVVNLDLSAYNLLKLPFLPISLTAALVLGAISALVMSWRFSSHLQKLELNPGIKKSYASQVLLFFQVFFAFVFITAALAMGIQYAFVSGLEWGFDGENTIQYAFFTTYKDGYLGSISGRLLEARLREIEGVSKVSLSGFSLAADKAEIATGFHEIFVYFDADNQLAPNVSLYGACLPAFFEIRDIRLIKGTYPEEGSWTYCLVNRSFVQKYLPNEEPLGKKLRIDEDTDFWIEISGVMEDLRFFPAHYPIEPMLLLASHYPAIAFQQISWQKGMKQQVLPAVEELYSELTRDGIFGYSSVELDAAQREFYQDDRIYKNISIFFSVFVCLIALMGVYAISSATIFAQMKDISIRKVCGAELPDLLKQYSRGMLYIFLAAGALGLFVASQLISFYAARFALVSGLSWLAYPLSVVLMAMVVFIPIYINILKAYRADSARYLQAD